MYHDNKCYIRLHGQDFAGFSLLGGVRQGCPLSPLLFAVCVDILLRMLERKLPDITCKAFADDLAAIVSDWWSQGPIIESIFVEFQQISNLRLNIKKIVCIPLWPKGLTEIEERIVSHIPGWGGLNICTKGTYLGFVVGPGKGFDSWIKPVAKYRDRVARWSRMGGGMQYAALAYNVFAISTLLYVGRLEFLPSFVIDLERKLVLSMFPGPGNWIIPEDAWFLKEQFGFAKSAQSLACSARAAKLRVATLGCHFHTKLVTSRNLRRLDPDNIYSRWYTLRAAMRDTDHTDRIIDWANWYEHNYCKVLIENAQWLQSKGITASSICCDITASSAQHFDVKELGKIKSQFQSHALRAIKRVVAPNAVERLRYKLSRWHGIPFGISGAPGRYCLGISRRLQYLSSVVNPRVQAAVFTTLWNGWCTHRRVQRRHWASNKCVFLCKEGAEDSLEHYCRCPVVLSVASHLFHSSYPPELAMNIWALNSAWLDTPHMIRSLSLLIYGVYMAFNTLRYSRVTDTQQAFQCIAQHCKQGAFGHQECMNHLDSCWHRPVSHIC